MFYFVFDYFILFCFALLLFALFMVRSLDDLFNDFFFFFVVDRIFLFLFHE